MYQINNSQVFKLSNLNFCYFEIKKYYFYCYLKVIFHNYKFLTWQLA